MTLLGETSRSQGIRAFRLGMLIAVEFDNPVARDAAEICEVWTNVVLPAEFESRKALGSEVRPQLPLLIPTLSPKAPAWIAQRFVIGTHNRAPAAGALTKDPLWGAAAAPFSPGPGEKI